MKGNLYDFQQIASAREKNFTQEEFASLLGITTVTLSRLENGHNASYELIIKACQKLNIDSSKIFYSSNKVQILT